jgi:hypothetical protein
MDCRKCKHCFEQRSKKIRVCDLCGAEKPEFTITSKHLANCLGELKRFNSHGTDHINKHICTNCFIKIFKKTVR